MGRNLDVFDVLELFQLYLWDATGLEWKMLVASLKQIFNCLITDYKGVPNAHFILGKVG